jgi:hypothetical protein
MKKSVLALALAFGVTTAFAQDLTSKKGEPILPEAGDWGLGVDAAPFINFAGNLFNNSSANNTPSWNFLTSNQTIAGKYFTDEKTAYRGAVRLGFGSTTDKNYVTQDIGTGTPSNPPATVVDKRTMSDNGIGLSGGIEMRRGKTRLQGYYGGEVGIWFGGSKTKYTYGNAASTSTNGLDPTSTDWSTYVAGSGAGTLASGVGRTTESKSGSSIQFGLRGFIGAEYFILAKISVAGEFGWGLGFTSRGDGSVTREEMATSGTSLQANTYKTGGSSSFGLDTDNWSNVFGSAGSLRMNFYF